MQSQNPLKKLPKYLQEESKRAEIFCCKFSCSKLFCWNLLLFQRIRNQHQIIGFLNIHIRNIWGSFFDAIDDNFEAKRAKVLQRYSLAMSSPLSAVLQRRCRNVLRENKDDGNTSRPCWNYFLPSWLKVQPLGSFQKFCR